ncbi:MAG: hypothetical protein IMZ61_11145 [Planctomycetes bacterium]|nr:hypothetical protein [Planctomycetota bacterium]
MVQADREELVVRVVQADREVAAAVAVRAVRAVIWEVEVEEGPHLVLAGAVIMSEVPGG